MRDVDGDAGDDRSPPRILGAGGAATARPKRSIYLAALDRYDRTVAQRAIDVLRDPDLGDSATRIRLSLEDACTAVSQRNDRRGCFLCSAAVDQVPSDPVIQEKVVAMMKRSAAEIKAVIEATLQDCGLHERNRTPTG